jgi:hypothetical protein
MLFSLLESVEVGLLFQAINAHSSFDRIKVTCRTFRLSREEKWCDELALIHENMCGQHDEYAVYCLTKYKDRLHNQLVRLMHHQHNNSVQFLFIYLQTQQSRGQLQSKVEDTKTQNTKEGLYI